jgi:hypothetical protein
LHNLAEVVLGCDRRPGAAQAFEGRPQHHVADGGAHETCQRLKPLYRFTIRFTHLRPISADGEPDLPRSNRDHHQALHEGRLIEGAGGPLVGLNVVDDHPLIVPYRPARHAFRRLETLALPQRRQRVFSDVVDLLTVGADQRDSLSATDRSRTRPNNIRDLVK